MKRFYCILVVGIVCNGWAQAHPQYKLELQSALAPGAVNFTGINSAGTMVKPYSTNSLLIRQPDGSYSITDPYVSSVYTVDHSGMAIAGNNRCFGAFSYVDTPATRNKPFVWSQDGGFQILPDPSTVGETSSYTMYAASPGGEVAGGTFTYHLGAAQIFIPTRFRQIAGSWTGELFNGEGLSFYVEEDGSAYGRFRGKAGIWRPDGSLYVMPAPFQGGSNGPYSAVVGRDSQGRYFGQGKDEIWIWNSLSEQPQRFTMPAYIQADIFSLRINHSGQGIFTSAGANSRPYIWNESDGPVNLNSLLLPEYSSTYLISSTGGIDDQGRIRAIARELSTNEFRGVYLTPVPEPSTLLLTGAGIGFLVFRRRRRGYSCRKIS